MANSTHELGVVEDTLYVPMLGRVYASERCRNILFDEKALELKDRLPAGLVESSTQTQYTYLASASRSANIAGYKRRVLGEYKAIVARTPSVGPMRKNMFVMTMYAGAFFIALYKAERERMTPEVIEGLIREVSYCPLMRKAKEGKSAFTEGMVESRVEQAVWSREHIDEYPMNWYWYFEAAPGAEEYYITHKQCGICKLCAREGCADITRYLCAMDYYTFEMQGAVLDRTKTLGYGDDECNFHLMSKARAAEIGFIKSPDAK